MYFCVCGIKGFVEKIKAVALFILYVICLYKHTCKKKKNRWLNNLNKCRFRYELDAPLLELIDFYVKSSRVTHYIYIYLMRVLVFVTPVYLISIDIVIPWCRMTFK